MISFLFFDRLVPLQKQNNQHQATACSNAIAARDALALELRGEQKGRARAEAALRSAQAQLKALDKAAQDVKVDHGNIMRAYESFEGNVKKGELSGV